MESQSVGGNVWDILSAGVVQATSNAVNRLTSPNTSAAAPVAGSVNWPSVSGAPTWVVIGGAAVLAVVAALLVKHARG